MQHGSIGWLGLLYDAVADSLPPLFAGWSLRLGLLADEVLSIVAHGDVRNVLHGLFEVEGCHEFLVCLGAGVRAQLSLSGAAFQVRCSVDIVFVVRYVGRTKPLAITVITIFVRLLINVQRVLMISVEHWASRPVEQLSAVHLDLRLICPVVVLVSWHALERAR